MNIVTIKDHDRNDKKQRVLCLIVKVKFLKHLNLLRNSKKWILILFITLDHW